MRWPRQARLEFLDTALDVELFSGESICDLRDRIGGLPGVPSYAMRPQQLRLVLKPGTPLVCNSTTMVDDYNIQTGSTIYCLPVAGQCLGRPQPFCTANCGRHRCKCGW